MDNILLTDLSALSWQAFYSNLDNMDIDDVESAILESILNYIKQYGKKFNTNNIVVCCDSPKSLRKEIYPEYKEKRKTARQEKSEEEQELQKAMLQFLPELKRILFKIGFKNILEQEGYEADDIFASIVYNDILSHYTLITADEDLFQCLRSNIDMYSPMKQKLYTYHSFIDEFNFEPQNWWKIKALAGCTSDNIIGVKGVSDKNGAKTAVKFFNKELNKTSKIYQKIHLQESKDLYKSNIPLVKLPYKGCNKFEIVENRFNKKAFLNICDEYQLPFSNDELLEDWREFFLGYSQNTKRKLFINNKKRLKLKRNKKA